MELGPLKIQNFTWWRYCWLTGNYCGLFRNSPEVIPGRWGFYILGLEFGNRNPGNKFGMWLKKIGIWPW